MKNNQTTDTSCQPSSNNASEISDVALSILAEKIKEWGKALGFQQVGISDIDLKDQEANLQAWLDNAWNETCSTR